jgi:hypothetical protein
VEAAGRATCFSLSAGTKARGVTFLLNPDSPASLLIEAEGMHSKKPVEPDLQW